MGMEEKETAQGRGRAQGRRMVLAFLVVLVLVYVFPENDLKRIMARSVDSEAAARARSADACAACRACTAAPTAANGSVAVGASALGVSGAAPRKEAAASVGGGDAATGAVATWGTHGPLSQDGDGTPSAGVHSGQDAYASCDPSNPVYGLSARELEILDLFAQGRSANWIAEHLTISKNTVRTHLRAIYSKLDVHSRQEPLDFLTGNRAE